jgi:hypothetical protein
MSRRLRILPAVILAGAGLAFSVARLLQAGDGSAASAAACTGAAKLDFACHERRALQIARAGGPAAALRDLERATKDNGYVRAACHQLTHRIGRATGAGAGIAAFKAGDPVCGAGYYHGVTEAVMAKLGADAAVGRAATICAALRKSGRRSPDETNCVHGMGHGFMGVLRRKVGRALRACDGLRESWQRRDCYSGVFMENHASAGGAAHGSLRPAEPLYPCTAVARRYKTSCYERQSTYALFVNDGDFGAVFDLCARAERGFRSACRRGLGGDVAAETKLVGAGRAQAAARRRLCMLGESARARADCVTGAVGQILEDLDGGPAQLDAFCAAFEVTVTQPEHAACLRASEAGYRALLAQQTGGDAGAPAAAVGDFVCHLKPPGARRRAQ